MPEQAAPSSPSLLNRYLPEGALSSKQKRFIVLGLIALAGIVIAFSGGSKTAEPMMKQASQPLTGPVPMQRIQESTEAMQQDVERLKQARNQLLQSQQTNDVLAQAQAADNTRNQAALQDAALQRAQFEQHYGAQGMPAGAPVQQTQERHASPIGRIGFETAALSASPARTEPEPVIRSQAAEGKSVQKDRNTLDFDPSLPTFTLPEGTVIETVLTNRLEGENNGQVDAMVTTPTYAPGTSTLLIPQGSRFVGEASAVSAFGQQRLAVSFHRIVVQKGSTVYSVPLDKAQPGLDQEGAAALHDKVNSHYPAIFGASLAIGAIGGLANIGNYSASGFDSMAQFRSGISQSMAQSSERVLDKFLNRMPTITIREGTRVKIMLTGDVTVPAYQE